MRQVEERSLSSILRSELLTTLIHNGVSEKVNAGGCACLDKFDYADVLRVWIGREQGLFEELVDETI